MKTSLLFFLFCATLLSTAAAPPTAAQVLAEAKTKTGTEQKAIFVHFGASWCGWCRKLDAFLEAPEIKPVFEKYFVPVKLVVQESEKNKALENPGADALQKRLGGPAGLPYFAFLDRDGAMIVNSKRPSGAGEGDNIGFPSEPQEVEWFMSMLKKATPRMAPDDIKIIETALRTPRK